MMGSGPAVRSATNAGIRTALTALILTVGVVTPGTHAATFYIGVDDTNQGVRDSPSGGNFSTQRDAWRSAVVGRTAFPFTASNLAKSDELSSAPADGDTIGQSLQFTQANTGLPTTFSVGTRPGDNDTYAYASANNTLGNTQSDDDDFQIEWTNPQRAFAFQIRGFDIGQGSVELFDNSSNLITSQTVGTAGFHTAEDDYFIGFVLDESEPGVSRLVWDDPTTSPIDNNAVGAFEFARPIPEPSAILVPVLGLLGWLVLRARRRSLL